MTSSMSRHVDVFHTTLEAEAKAIASDATPRVDTIVEDADATATANSDALRMTE